jgi:uncharacterized protein YaiL (DUF2058 family)
MSLRDELVKAGLVSPEKARETETNTRKQAHKSRKDKAAGDAETARRAEAQRKRQQALARQRERDRQLNRQREEQKAERARLARARQLIDSNRLNDPGAELRYNFVARKRFIRYVRVTEQQQRLLGRGRIGIAVNDMDPYDYPLIPRETALELAKIYPQKLLLLHPESSSEDGDDFNEA